MPELPEVETIARALAQEVTGRVVEAVEAPDPSALHPDAESFRALVLGRSITAVGRRGKLLLLRLSALQGDGGAVVAAHLRMTGRLFVLGPGQETERQRAVLRLSGGLRLSFSDLRRFGSLNAFPAGGLEAWPFYASLGPEPLEMDAAAFRERIGRGRARIKALLLDQRVLAGVGNIYADEALFRAGIRPDTPAGAVPARKLDGLLAALKAVLRQAIAENGSSIRDYRTAFGDAGAFQNHFRAYGRAGKPCLVCGEAMRAMKVAGRTSCYCPRCQPGPGD